VEVPEADRLLVNTVDGTARGDGPWNIAAEATEFVR
jgi:hypothetical protein|tara:strand:+ start:3895 stop:4002 length:108 start_codon:yes stop_codon:yes gene_type:complete